MQRKPTYIVAGLLIVVAVIYLMISNTGSSARYFLTIEEVHALGDDALRRDLTVSGAVLGDSISEDAQGPRVTFTIVQAPGDPREVERAGGLAQVLHDAVNNPLAPTLDVVYEGSKPDRLQHETQVIARGRIGEDGRFYAGEILLKCPSRYEAAIPGQSGE